MDGLIFYFGNEPLPFTPYLVLASSRLTYIESKKGKFPLPGVLVQGNCIVQLAVWSSKEHCTFLAQSSYLKREEQTRLIQRYLKT